MKAVIVFHSIYGNDYLMARAFASELKSAGQEVGLYRVADPDWVEKPDISEKAREIIREMRTVPEAAPKALESADLVILGSPTYFGNVTGEMKAFMDSTGGLWFHGKLIGKKCVAFTSAGNTEGGGVLCLQAIHTYAMYMGMACLPVPVTLVPGENWPALGIIHYSNGKQGEALDAKTERAIKNYCAWLAKMV
jgi:NAD(P)H dehydrogenase (quinone)